MKLILILVISVLICSGCGNKGENIPNANVNHAIGGELETEADKSDLRDDVDLENMDSIKISKEDIAKQYQEWRGTDYSNLNEKLKNYFYPIVDVEIKPGMIYEIDFDSDSIFSDVYINNEKLYVDGNVCADTKGLRCGITDLDRNDKQLEIVFTATASVNTYTFWNYDGMQMKKMLEILDAEMDGYGAIVSHLGENVVVDNSDREVKGEFCYYKLIENSLEKQNIDSVIQLYTDNVVFINSLEMHENDYLLKGSLYKKMTIAKDEVELKLKNKQPISIGGEQYSIVKASEDNKHFELQTINDVVHYNLWLNDNDSYDVISTTEFSDVWELSGEAIELLVSKDARIVPYYEGLGDMKIQDYYFENKGIVRQAENTINPSNVYSNFVLKDGKCIEFSSCPTGH